ncbi:relaxase/mobilization nuclease domain-containing protein [uncultured Rhodospira sp.]|uniref:relaxase/mobilization nuclease domain-containing protein n=1 Tax=uncultured Rhodospira sp. TaxID=1936189 RepID=UPI00262784F6|nr:relaxase/mobilization nuclease domain-containing protein [uncultured Rhodospira sp.]
MILKGNQRGGARQLAAHLLKAENEHVEVHELRGFMADDLTGAFREFEAVARGTRCRQPLFSVSLNPPPNERVPVEVFEDAVARLEAKLGLEGQPRALVFHEKEGRRHAHCVWSRIDTETMTAINLPHTKRKMRDISKALFLEQGWTLPRGLMDSKERDPFNFTRAEWQQTRRAGTDPRALKAMFAECWAATRDGPALSEALKARGYTLARGDRRGVVAVDFRGEAYALARYAGVKTRDVKARLGDGRDLPPIADVRARIAEQMATSLRTFIADAEKAMTKRSAELAFRKAEMVQRHRQERRRLDEGQAERWQRETAARAARLPRGFKGIWHRVTSEYARVRRLNEAETYRAMQRDRDQRQDLIDQQQGERAGLQQDIARVRRDHVRDLERLHRDVAHYQHMGTGQDRQEPTPTRAPARDRTPQQADERTLDL